MSRLRTVKQIGAVYPSRSRSRDGRWVAVESATEVQMLWGRARQRGK
jgi:hypothetical protein